MYAAGSRVLDIFILSNENRTVALGREDTQQVREMRVCVVPGWVDSLCFRLGILVSLRGMLEASGAIRYRSAVGQVNGDIFVRAVSISTSNTSSGEASERARALRE